MQLFQPGTPPLLFCALGSCHASYFFLSFLHGLNGTREDRRIRSHNTLFARDAYTDVSGCLSYSLHDARNSFREVEDMSRVLAAQFDRVATFDAPLLHLLVLVCISMLTRLHELATCLKRCLCI